MGGTPGQIKPTKKPPDKERAFEVSSTESKRYQRGRKMMIPITLSDNGTNIKTTAMIDCGGDDSFIDLEFAKNSGISLNLRKKPITVRGVDGTEIKSGPVTHDIKTQIQIGQHHEDLRLYGISMASAPVILGLPWLQLHNPLIDWREGTVTFSSPKCSKDCLEQPTTVKAVEEIKAIQDYLKKAAVEQETEQYSSEEEENEEPIRFVSIVELQESLEDREYLGITSIKDIEDRIDFLEVCNTSGTRTEKPEKNVKATDELVPREYHKYLNLFEEAEPTKPPPRRKYDHKIVLEEGKDPPWERLRELDIEKLRTMKDYIQKSLERGWIRPSSSPAGAPVLFVKKKDGSVRVCIDYRGLNDMTIKDRTPLPLIGESLDRLSKAKIFTKLDIRDAYHNLRIAEGDEWKTAFRTKYGLFEYLVMPFGLTNAPATFQRWMNELLSDCLDIYALAYLDDIMIYSDNIEEHRKQVRHVLQRLTEAGVKLKASKCEFHTDRVEYLGFVIGPQGIEMDKEKIKTVTEWKQPTRVKEIQSFLGFCNFYRRFIKDFASLARPMTKLTHKDSKFEWGEEQEKAFETLKKAITSEPVLSHYDPEKQLTLETDASDYGIGVVCSQADENGNLHPIGFYSRQLKPAELNYEIHDKELLAIVEGLTRFGKYCMTSRHKIKILTDHKNLEYWNSKRDLNLRQARWSEKLANYDFKIYFRPGKLCGKPDILSRESGDSPWEGEARHRQNKSRKILTNENFDNQVVIKKSTTQKELDDDRFYVSANAATLSENRRETSNDTYDKQGSTNNAPISEVLRTGKDNIKDDEIKIREQKEASYENIVKEIKEKTNNDENMQEVIKLLATGIKRSRKFALGLCEMENNILTYDGLVWVPEDDGLKLKILKQHHDEMTAGHPGRAKTLELITRTYYWPGQREYVSRYVENCDMCRRIKPVRHAPYGLLKPLQLPERPWNSISMDFITGLPKVENDNAIWVVVDRMTKMSHFIPIPDTLKPDELAIKFMTYIFKHHGLPSEIISDRGSVFTSKVWTEITKLLGIRRSLSTAYHPQSDGQTERINGILEQFLRAYCNYQQDNWRDLLTLAEFCYNNTVTETTKVSPFFANYGYHPRTFNDLIENKNTRSAGNNNYIESLQMLHEQLKGEIAYAQATQSEYANRKRLPDLRLSPGDKVWLRRKNIRTTRPSTKLDWKYLGPYNILQRVGKKAYKLELPPAVKLHPVFHSSLLEPVSEKPPIPGQQNPEPPAIEINGQEEWEVEYILDSKLIRNKIHYRVKWKDYHDLDKTWYPAENFENAPETINDFHNQYPTKPRQ